MTVDLAVLYSPLFQLRNKILRGEQPSPAEVAVILRETAGQPLPPELVHYIADILEGKPRRPGRPPNQRASTRDWFLAFAVAVHRKDGGLSYDEAVDRVVREWRSIDSHGRSTITRAYARFKKLVDY